jgi:hypothetical protein
MASPKDRSAKSGSDSGNFVAEWFGHRVYPVVGATPQSLEDQQTGRCPFLSEATGDTQPCIKPESAKGICTISSVSNRLRQDWLVCPYRGLDHPLVDDVARRLFGIRAELGVNTIPGPILANRQRRAEFARHVAAGHAGVVYLQSKLGGEISIAPTDRSPELSFDFTLVEVRYEDGSYRLGRYGILEVQTMDYHGSYKAAVKNLSDALRLHGSAFHKELSKNPRWISEKIEGPNIANVFKRTFYQMMLKFQIGADPDCGGCVLALPQSVWDSWQRHLGRPDLVSQDDGTFALVEPGKTLPSPIAAWIYVFDIEASADATPNTIVLRRVIATNADAVAHYALKVAPQAAVAGTGSADRILASISRRLIVWWPELKAPRGPVIS